MELRKDRADLTAAELAGLGVPVGKLGSGVDLHGGRRGVDGEVPTSSS